MKRTDDVFFFTLIDFLVQVFFFGLLLYTLGSATKHAARKAQDTEAVQIKKLLETSGASNLTELTDELANMAPVSELKGTADFIRTGGGLEKAKKLREVVEQAGGAENLMSRLERLQKLEEGAGKPPCLYKMVDENRVAKPVATVLATDADIRFQSSTRELENMLSLIGRSYESVRVLSLREFQAVFAPLVRARPECRYTLRFLERTRFVDARDAASHAFYLNIGKS